MDIDTSKLTFNNISIISYDAVLLVLSGRNFNTQELLSALGGGDYFDCEKGIYQLIFNNLVERDMSLFVIDILNEKQYSKELLNMYVNILVKKSKTDYLIQLFNCYSNEEELLNMIRNSDGNTEDIVKKISKIYALQEDTDTTGEDSDDNLMDTDTYDINNGISNIENDTNTISSDIDESDNISNVTNNVSNIVVNDVDKFNIYLIPILKETKCTADATLIFNKYVSAFEKTGRITAVTPDVLRSRDMKNILNFKLHTWELFASNVSHGVLREIFLSINDYVAGFNRNQMHAYLSFVLDIDPTTEHFNRLFQHHGPNLYNYICAKSFDPIKMLNAPEDTISSLPSKCHVRIWNEVCNSNLQENIVKVFIKMRSSIIALIEENVERYTIIGNLNEQCFNYAYDAIGYTDEQAFKNIYSKSKKRSFIFTQAFIKYRNPSTETCAMIKKIADQYHCVKCTTLL